MRDLEARLAAAGALPVIDRDAIRRAAVKLREETPLAPCGCTPKVKCDQHCRARIGSYRDAQGDLTWIALCTGSRGQFKCGVAKGDLDRVHNWATDHVAEHRERAAEHTQ